MIRTYLLDYENLPDPLEQKAVMEGLSYERIEKTARLKQPGARKQSLGAGLMMDYVRKKAGAGAQISYHSFGKPSVEGIPFSISHTDHYVMLSMWDETGCGTGDDGEDLLIGCDIERIRRYDPRIARRFFTETEYQNLEAAEEAEGSRETRDFTAHANQNPEAAGGQAELFSRYWTRKESVMKLTGLGMALPMELFEVCGWQAAPDREKIKDWSACMKEKEQPEYCQAAETLLNRQLFFKEYWQDGYCLTVCSTKDRFAQKAVFWDAGALSGF